MYIYTYIYELQDAFDDAEIIGGEVILLQVSFVGLCSALFCYLF
jgi:hypothetical protein